VNLTTTLIVALLAATSLSPVAYAAEQHSLAWGGGLAGGGFFGDPFGFPIHKHIIQTLSQVNDCTGNADQKAYGNDYQDQNQKDKQTACLNTAVDNAGHGFGANGVGLGHEPKTMSGNSSPTTKSAATGIMKISVFVRRSTCNALIPALCPEVSNARVIVYNNLNFPECCVHIFYAGSPTNQPTEVAIPIGHPYFITVFPIGGYPMPGEGNFVWEAAYFYGSSPPCVPDKPNFCGGTMTANGATVVVTSIGDALRLFVEPLHAITHVLSGDLSTSYFKT
jgi:hypothetical protein